MWCSPFFFHSVPRVLTYNVMLPAILILRIASRQNLLGGVEAANPLRVRPRDSGQSGVLGGCLIQVSPDSLTSSVFAGYCNDISSSDGRKGLVSGPRHTFYERGVRPTVQHCSNLRLIHVSLGDPILHPASKYSLVQSRSNTHDYAPGQWLVPPIASQHDFQEANECWE